MSDVAQVVREVLVGVVVVGPMEAVAGAVLGLLAAVAVLSVAVTVLSAIALAVAPVLARLVRRFQLWLWRDWHPPTDWLPAPAPREEPEQLWPPQVRGVSCVSTQQSDARVRLVTAQVAFTARDSVPSYTTMTVVHAQLAPAARLELPARRGCRSLVHVVAGRVTVGVDRTPVGAGQHAVVAAGDRLSVVAGPDDRAGDPEVLVVGEISAAPGVAAPAAPAPSSRGGRLLAAAGRRVRPVRARHRPATV